MGDSLRRARAARLLLPSLLAVAVLALAAPAVAAPKQFRVAPGVGIGPVKVGDSKADLADRLGAPRKEGPVWAYTVRAGARSGVVKVLFDGRLAMNVFTVDSAFVYRGVHVGTTSDAAISTLRGAGFQLGRCGPGRALFLPNQRTMLGLYKGEVENVFVVRDGGACED